MNKKLGIIVCSALLLAGCGVPKLENGKEAVVTFKDDAKISVDDLYTRMKDDYALSNLLTMIDTYVLETEFADYAKTAKVSAENNVKAALQNYEDENEFLQILQQYYGYPTIDAYQEAIYLGYMQEHATEEYSKTLVTDKDIENYYKKSAKGDVEIAHILITADVTSDMSEDDKTKAEDEAKQKAEDLLKQITESKTVDETFKKLAKENSQDEATKDKDGAIGKINYLDFPNGDYDELLDAAYKIKDGEVYDKVVTASDGYHIVYRTKSYEKDTLENLKDKIINYLATDLRNNEENSAKISYDASTYYREKYQFNITDSELKKQYDNYNQRVLASFSSDSDDENE